MLRPGDVKRLLKLLPKDERRGLLRAANRSRRLSCVCAALVAGGLVAMPVVMLMVRHLGGNPVIWAVVVAGVLGGGIGWILGLALSDAAFEELCRRNRSICRHCGYLVGDHDPCPECGRSREAAVRRRFGIWRH